MSGIKQSVYKLTRQGSKRKNQTRSTKLKVQNNQDLKKILDLINILKCKF